MYELYINQFIIECFVIPFAQLSSFGCYLVEDEVLDIYHPLCDHDRAVCWRLMHCQAYTQVSRNSTTSGRRIHDIKYFTLFGLIDCCVKSFDVFKSCFVKKLYSLSDLILFRTVTFTRVGPDLPRRYSYHHLKTNTVLGYRERTNNLNHFQQASWLFISVRCYH